MSDDLNRFDIWKQFERRRSSMCLCDLPRDLQRKNETENWAKKFVYYDCGDCLWVMWRLMGVERCLLRVTLGIALSLEWKSRAKFNPFDRLHRWLSSSSSSPTSSQMKPKLSHMPRLSANQSRQKRHPEKQENSRFKWKFHSWTGTSPPYAFSEPTEMIFI